MVDRLTVIAFATAHVSALTLVSVLALHLVGTLGDLLEPIGTATGVGLFLVLWAITGYTHHRGFARADPWDLVPDRSVGRYLVVGSAWGGITGLAFLWILLFPFLLVVVLADPMSSGQLVSIPTLLLLVLVSGISVVVGAIVGLLAAAADVLVVDAVDRLSSGN